MSHAYTEDQLVEQPAIGLFAELGWQTVSAMEEIFGAAEPSPQPSPSGRGSTAVSLGRETKGEVVLVSRLWAALERFFEWKHIEREDEPRRVSLEVMVRGGHF